MKALFYYSKKQDEALSYNSEQTNVHWYIDGIRFTERVHLQDDDENKPFGCWKTFSYNPNKSLVENWKQWVNFRFGNNLEDMLDWEDEIKVKVNDNERIMTVKEVNEIMKEYCFPD